MPTDEKDSKIQEAERLVELSRDMSEADEINALKKEAELKTQEKKPSFISSIREKLNQAAASSKAKFEEHQAERFRVQTIEKEAREAAAVERKEINLAEKYENAYEKELHKKSLAQKLGGAVSNIGARVQTISHTPQHSKPTPTTFGSYGGLGTPNYGLIGQAGKMTPLFGSHGSPSHTWRGTRRVGLGIPPLITTPVTGRRKMGRATSTLPPLTGIGGVGKVGKMPSLFGSMKRGKKRRGFF